MSGYDALYREDATVMEQVECYQRLINSGEAWRLEGHVGRTAMSMIEGGTCMLGMKGHRDYYGNKVPARSEVQAGTKGSYQFVVQRSGKLHADHIAEIE